MGYDLYDFFAGAMGRPDPRQQLYNSLGQGPAQAGSPQGPQPLAAGTGAPSQGGGPPGAAPGAAAAPAGPQAYQSPPDLATAYTALAGGGNAPPANAPPLDMAQTLLALQQRDQARNQFNSGLGLLAASMYPGRHPEMIMKAMTGQQGEDAGSTFNALYQIHQMQQQQQSVDAFRRSIPDIATKLGMTQDQVLALGPQGAGEVMAKIAEANAGVTGDPTQKELAQARKEWHDQNPGKTDVDMFASDPSLRGPVDFVAGRTQQIQDQAQAGKDKVNAISSFHVIDPTLSAAEDNIKWLKDHPDATVRAVHTPGLASAVGGAVANATGVNLPGVDQDALEARSRLDWLKKNLYAERFAGTKNIRSNTEANNLGASASNVDDIKNSEQQILDEVNRLYSNAMTARANLHAAAGKVIPSKYRGLADPAYLDSKSLLYNGGKEAPDDSSDGGGGGGGSGGGGPAPVAVQTPDDVRKLRSGTPFIIPSGPHKGETGYAP